ncbi:hypothetical protein MKW98_011276, partial [Papaver atlanticum]
MQVFSAVIALELQNKLEFEVDRNISEAQYIVYQNCIKLLKSNVNEGFSGGEKKRNEILQLAISTRTTFGIILISFLTVLGDLAILNEIHSGLDVDALQDVEEALNELLTPQKSVLMVTHYQRLLDIIKPKFVHLMEDGKIVKTSDISIAAQLEKEGYKGISS